MHLAIKIILFLASLLIASATSEKYESKSRSKRDNDQPVGRRPDDPDRNPIVRGADVQRGNWKWQVFIELGNGKDQCGGSLLDNNWILTAAHCFRWYEPTKVIIGTVRIRNFDFSAVIRTVASVKCHEGYNRTTFENDICLLKLSAPVNIGIYIAKAILPSAATPLMPGKVCKVAGWGLDERGRLPDILKEAPVMVFQQAQCQRLYGSFVIPKSHFCAGYPGHGPGPDTCRGDSGGSLVCLENGVYVLHGITSFGPKNCGNDKRPGAYTRVSDYLEWIYKETENYKWGPWTTHPCSVSCGSGVQKMERNCFLGSTQVVQEPAKCSPGLGVMYETCWRPCTYDFDLEENEVPPNPRRIDEEDSFRTRE